MTQQKLRELNLLNEQLRALGTADTDLNLFQANNHKLSVEAEERWSKFLNVYHNHLDTEGRTAVINAFRREVQRIETAKRKEFESA